MEEQFKKQISELEEEYHQEKEVKQKMEDELTIAKDQLENIEENFTLRVGELRE